MKKKQKIQDLDKKTLSKMPKRQREILMEILDLDKEKRKLEQLHAQIIIRQISLKGAFNELNKLSKTKNARKK